MRLDEPAQDKGDEESAGEADKHRLRELAYCRQVYGIEDRRRNDSRKRMQQPRRTEQLTSLVGRHMLCQSRLESRRTDTTNACDGTGQDQQRSGTREGIAQVANRVEEHCYSDYDKIKRVAARGALFDSAGFATDVDCNERKHHDKAENSASINDREENALIEDTPAELVVGVDEDYRHRSHGYSK